MEWKVTFWHSNGKARPFSLFWLGFLYIYSSSSIFSHIPSFNLKIVGKFGKQKHWCKGNADHLTLERDLQRSDKIQKLFCTCKPPLIEEKNILHNILAFFTYSMQLNTFEAQRDRFEANAVLCPLLCIACAWNHNKIHRRARKRKRSVQRLMLSKCRIPLWPVQVYAYAIIGQCLRKEVRNMELPFT